MPDRLCRTGPEAARPFGLPDTSPRAGRAPPLLSALLNRIAEL